MSGMRQCSLIPLIAVVCLNGPNLLALDNACSGDQHTTSVTVRIEDSLVLVPVRVDDYGPQLTFLFDTGDEKTIIDQQIADKLRLQPIMKLLLSGPRAKYRQC